MSDNPEKQHEPKISEEEYRKNHSEGHGPIDLDAISKDRSFKPVKISIPVPRLDEEGTAGAEKLFELWAGGQDQTKEDPTPRDVFKEGFQEGRQAGYEEGFTRGGRLAASQAMGIRLKDTPRATADEAQILKQFGTRQDGLTIQMVELLHANSVLSAELRIKAALQALKEVFGVSFVDEHGGR